LNAWYILPVQAVILKIFFLKIELSIKS